MPTDNDIFSTGILYINNTDGTKTELGKIKEFNVSVDLAKDKDQTAIHTFNKCEGSFKIKNISGLGLTRMISKYKNRNKYLKRVKNRQKLYNDLKKKGRKL